MAVSWLVIGAMFCLCYSHLPTAREHGGSVSFVSSFSKIDVEDELDDKSVHGYDDESNQMSDAFRFAYEKSYEVLEITGVNGAARVVPYVRRNSASSEKSALIKHRSSWTLLESGSDYGTVDESSSEADKAVCRSCCQLLCSVSRHICTHLLWGFSMLVWEEIVLTLYVISIMIFCEMAMEVRIVF